VDSSQASPPAANSGGSGTRVGEHVLFREPPGVGRAQRVDQPRPHVQPARARSAARVLVRAADGEIRLERSKVERQRARVVVDVEQHERAGAVRVRDPLRQLAHHLAGAEHHGREHHQVGTARIELAPRHDLELDASLLAVHAQDEVDRIEFAVARDHARLPGKRVQHRAQPLAGAGLRNDQVLGRADQPAGEQAELLAAFEPCRPGAVHVLVPGVERGAHVLGGAVGRAAERMVGEVDLLALQHAREARMNLLPQPALIQARS
jgi:hypothetical protein